MEVLNSKPDFTQMEHEILQFWQENRCFDKLREKNRHNKPFRFLDGPITANNPMGIHHAWGRTIKDTFLRYKAMNGYSCHYRNGFDTQGLWVEVEVERELGFKDKKDIESFGTDNFTRKCIERIRKYSGRITEQSTRLGQWMDWQNSYYTHTDENISGIWTFLKKCHENGWLVQSNRPMPWCPRCGTSLSEHEMSGSHQEIEHAAVFVRLPLLDRPWDILVWTTTPWTLAANVALAVHPELEYAVVQCEGNSRPLVLAKKALPVLQKRGEILQMVTGKELDGLSYETCFPFLPVQSGMPHKIVLWDMVSSEEGSGVVHIAPGCGAEDYELGLRLGLQAVCPIDDAGVFTEEYEWLAGQKASDAATLIFSRLEEAGKLYKTHLYRHSYPVCWRCKTEVLFRLVREWYVKTDDIRPKLLEAASKVKWEPEYIGKRMQDWLANMGDWNISRKRYYGLPLPFYPGADCGTLTVIGSKEELYELGGAAARELPELHRPWIDQVAIQCPSCGGMVSRISEVGDVWLDAGIVPFSTLGYFSDRKLWEKYYPAEWVVEMREQVRLWFYSMLFMSVTLEGRAPYERVLAHGSVVAEDGTRFSKTGFMIHFDTAAEKLGSDAIRYLFAGAGMTNDVRFGYNLGEEARRKILSFWNICVFFMTYASLEKPEVTKKPSSEALEITDRWVLARTNQFVREVSGYYEAYKTPELVKAFEVYVEDVSKWYVRINRKRFWKQEQSQSKQAAYWCLYQALKATLQVMAPVTPFITEYLWQHMVRFLEHDCEESVHLSRWPSAVDNADESGLLEQTELVRDVIGIALKIRNENQLKVKQPLSCMMIMADKDKQEIVGQMHEIVREELNVKSVVFMDDESSLYRKQLALNFRKAGSVLKNKAQELAKLLERASEEEMEEMAGRFRKGEAVVVPGWPEPVPSEFFTEIARCKSSIALARDKGFTVALDVNLTEELIQEGLYRELLRNCQLLRKEAGLKVEQRIRLSISHGDRYPGSTPDEGYSDRSLSFTLDENNFSIAAEKGESFPVESQKAQGKGGDVPNRLQAVLEKYGAAIAEETLASGLVGEVSDPVISKEITVGDHVVIVQIGLA